MTTDTFSGPGDPDLVELLAESLAGSLADPAFDPYAAAAAAGPEPAARAYDALRRITAALDHGRPLLADHRRLRALLELAAMADPVLFHVMFLHHCMTVGPALDYGAAGADLAALNSGGAVGAALMTELGQGSSAADIRTEASYDPRTRGFVLHTPDPAAAKYPVNVGLPGVPRLAVVSARLRTGGADRGTFLFLVPLRDAGGPAPGVRIARRPPTALLPLDYASVSFDRVRVPYHRWLADGAGVDADGTFRDPLADPGARTARSLGMSRFACGAVTAGLAAAARAAVAIALHHAGRRRTYDRPTGRRVPALAHLNQRRSLFGAAARAYAATVLARSVTGDAWALRDGGGRGGGPDAAVMRRVALAKAATDRLAEEAVSLSRAAAGAAAFFSENRLLDYHALALAFRSAGGDNLLILLDAARSMAAGAGYAPPRPGGGAGGGRWIRLFRAREHLLHARLRAALEEGAAGGADPFAVWDASSDLARRFADAHVARVTAEAVRSEADAAAAAAGRACSEEGEAAADAAAVRAGLFELFCLEEVERDAGWFLQEGLLTAAEARGLPSSSAAACRALVPRTKAVLGLMDLPAALARGALAGPDYIAELAGGTPVEG
ncbi:hypothetical protein [Streptomyces sp. NPDC090022]|uniref:acyl-CoA dehydrogenase family protein n=1 Tax=Streptomyces sp. NPDC090022 TaxID=3365920 RepID=UPI0038116DAD